MRTLFGRNCIAAAFVISLTTLAFSQSVSIAAPANGSNVTSPVHVIASANGGNGAVTAMRLYVDNQAVTTVDASQMNTSVALSAGSHNVVVVGWNTKGASFTKSENVKVVAAAPPSAAAVNISSPTPSATGSPLHFIASATVASGRSVVAMAVYLDNQLKYQTSSASVNVLVSAAAGSHNAVVQSWDNTGAVTKNQLTVDVAAPIPMPTPTPTPTPTPVSGAYATDFHSTSNWLATQSAPSGALLYTTQRINAYYANLAAIGMVKDPTRYVQVENWMRWYIAHLNRSDKWNLGGTMYDYNIVNGAEVSTGDADSTDSYAATFLSLAYAYFATGNPAAQSYVRSISADIDLIGQVLAQTQQSDGLTWAKPDYQIKYLMDNSEVFRGLADVSTLFGSMGDSAKQVYYGTLATNCQRGVWSMWLGKNWAVYKDALGRLAAPTLATWYPDASSQVYPVLYGVVPGTDSRAQTAYTNFNSAWPKWPQLSYNAQDPFPWVMVADAAALMGDKTRVNTYATSARAKWVNAGFPWTWYSMEAGWYLRLAAFMQGGTSL